MILGIGIDLVEVGRMDKILDRYGLRFLSRIFTPVELAGMPTHPAAYLASRFAAKEATAKALGTGFSQGVTAIQIETSPGPGGQPCLRLYKAAADKARIMGAAKKLLSISHERSCAVALVILEN